MTKRKSLRIKFLVLPIKWRYLWRDVFRDTIFSHASRKLNYRTRERIRWCGSCKERQETCSRYFTDWTDKILLVTANRQHRNETRGLCLEEATVSFARNGHATPSRKVFSYVTIEAKERKIAYFQTSLFPPIFCIKYLIYRISKRNQRRTTWHNLKRSVFRK